MGENSPSSPVRPLGRIALKRLRVPAPTGDRSVDRRALLVALSEMFGVPALDLEQVCINLSDLRCIPRELAEHHCLIPVLAEQDRVFVAMKNPADRDVSHEVEFVSGRRVYAYVAPAAEIAQLIEKAYLAKEQGHSFFVGSHCPRTTLEKAGLWNSNGGMADVSAPLREAEQRVGQGSADLEGSQQAAPRAATFCGQPTHSSESATDSSPLLSARPLSLSDELVPRDDSTPHRTVSAIPPQFSSQPPALQASGTSPSQSAEWGLEVLSALEGAFDDGQEEASAVCRLSEFPCDGAKTALLVEEDEDTRHIVENVLVDEGFRVRLARDGREALQRIKEYPPALLVLGAMLPEIHGIEVARRLKETRRYSAIPIVLVGAPGPRGGATEEPRNTSCVEQVVFEPYRKEDIRRAVAGAMSTQQEQPLSNMAQRVEEALEQGVNAHREGRDDDAIRCLETGASLDPLAYRLHFHLGLLYAKKGRTFDGIRALERAVEINPEHFAGLKNLAIMYFQAGFLNRAAELWERGLLLAPDSITRAAIRDHLAALLSQDAHS